MYTAGTISGTKGSTKITGKSTQWLSNLYNILEGQVIIIYTPTSSNAYSIKNIKSNTEIELSKPLYDTFTNATYEIFTTIDNTTSDAAVKIATSIARNNEFMGLMNQWTTGTGTVTVNWGGEQVKLTTVDQMNKNIDGKISKIATGIKDKTDLNIFFLTADGGFYCAGSDVINGVGMTADYTWIHHGATTGATKYGVLRAQTIATAASPSRVYVKHVNNGSWSNWSRLTDSAELDKKLDKTGGTITGEIDVQRINSSKLSGIGVKQIINASEQKLFVGNTANISELRLQTNSGIVTVDKGDVSYSVLHTGNTTKDANGNIKAASPIIKIFADDIKLNDESEGVEMEHLGVGHYLIKGVVGFNADGAWGINNGFVIPQDHNGKNMVIIDYEVKPDGNIELFVFHNQNIDMPERFQNKRIKHFDEEGQPVYFGNYEPCDVPESRWIDMRVEMPPNSLYNQKQAEAQRLAEIEAERLAKEEADRVAEEAERESYESNDGDQEL